MASSEDLDSGLAIGFVWLEMRYGLFPRWKASSQWRIALATFTDGSYFAHVDIQAKTVFFNRPGTENGVEIVHVMSHAATNSGSHTERWYRRMMKAAAKLRRIGQEDLAFMVEHNAQRERGTRGSPRDLIDWSQPVLETPSAAVLFNEHLGRGGLGHVTYSDPPASPRSRNHGVLVASRYALEALSPQTVPWPEKIVSVLVRADVEFDLHAVHVPPGSSNGWIKIETLEGIYRGLARKPTRPRILCGDFNTPQCELASGQVVTWAEVVTADGVRRASRIDGGSGERWDAAERAVLTGLADHDLPDIFRLLYGYGVDGFSWVLTRKGRQVKRRFDHILASRSLRPRECSYLHAWREEKLSDHSAIEAVFEPGRARG